jgi:acetoin utilization deacetylase AcuC-like enzyme
MWQSPNSPKFSARVEADFAWATQKLMEIARSLAHERVGSAPEGGYDLDGLARSVAAHVTALMEG